MTQYIPKISSIKNSLAAWLPQNQHAQEADKLSQEIQSLNQSLANRTGEVFKRKLSETSTLIQHEKEKCLNDLKRMNGSYYQDPNSTLKKAWDKLVETVQKALGIKVEKREQLDDISEQLNDLPETEAVKTAKSALNGYTLREKARNNRQKQLNLILGTEKNSADFDNTLTTRKVLLEQRYKDLCGEYYADPKGQLHQAWQNYQTAIATDNDKEQALNTYQDLDEYRKQIESQLYEVGQQLSISASKDRTYESLTVQSISEEVEKLKEIQKTESDLSRIDWRGITTSAAKVALLGAGYILLST